MLSLQQEKLLVHLRKQLEIYAAAGILSRDQQRSLAKLSSTHDEANQLIHETTVANDHQFEIESKIAFPSKVTPDALVIDSLDTCRLRLGFSPVLPFRYQKRQSSTLGNDSLSGTGWDVMATKLRFEDEDPNRFDKKNNGNKNQQHDNNNNNNNNDEVMAIPALHEIYDAPTQNQDAMTDFIQQNQNEKCVSCYKKLERTRLGLGAYKARWCHEANGFCCETCNTGSVKCVLPAYVMLRWDFDSKIVRNNYGINAEMEWQKPLLCPGAENPQLFDQVPLLQDLRRLRFQLSKLFDIGKTCSDFMRALTTEPERPVLGTLGQQQPSQQQQQLTAASGANFGQSGGGANRSNKASFFISQRQRYLVEESEMWSLSDLEQVHRACPDKFSMNAADLQSQQLISRNFLQQSQFAKFLQSVRDAMIRHVLSECKDCKMRAAHVCLECGVEPPIYYFDVRNCVECSRCHSVFHRKCWEAIQKQDGTCPGCAGKTLDSTSQ